MPNVCCFCKKVQGSLDHAVPFHRFPKDPIQRNIWLQNCKLEDTARIENKTLCSDHFNSSCYINNSNRLLKNAVPTIFPGGAEHLTPEVVETLDQPAENTMGVCFLCDKKLNRGCTQVSSSITSYNNVPFPEKIAEFMGDEFVVIVTSADHMCKKCTTILNDIDKLEYDLELVKNTMFSQIQKKYGILPPYQGIKDDEIVNRHLKSEELLEQPKVPSGLRVGVSPTVTTPAVITPVQTPLKCLKTKQQQHQQQQQQQPPSQQKIANKMKHYKCAFCGFQSKDLGRVRFHLRTHKNNKEPKKTILNQTAGNALTTKEQLYEYRCQVCSKTFDCRVNFLDHIRKGHNQPTSTGERETEDSCMVTTKVMKPKPSKTQENNLQADSMDIGKHQKDNNKGTVDMDMMFNDYVPTEGSADIKQEKDTENSQKYETVNEAKLKIKPEPAQEETADEEKEENKEDTTILKQEEADQKMPDIKKEVDENYANVGNKTGDLDVESM